MNVRAATVGSVNCAYVRSVLERRGHRGSSRSPARSGSPQRPCSHTSPQRSGTIEATPLEMATVGATIAANGVRREPVLRAAGGGVRRDRPLDETGRPGIPAISPDTAACEMDILQGVVTGGTGTRARLAGRPVAGKTGTTDNKTDAWFLGFTPQLSATVWHGASTGAVPGAGFGGEIPARIWQAFMSAQLAGQPVAPFPPPGSRCNEPGQLVFDFGRVHPWALALLFPPPPFPFGPPLPPGTTHRRRTGPAPRPCPRHDHAAPTMGPPGGAPRRRIPVETHRGGRSHAVIRRSRRARAARRAGASPARAS